MSKVWTKDEITDMIMKDDRALTRGLIAIWKFQTADEKISRATSDHNRVGFSAFDAEFLSSCAERVAWRGLPLTRNQIPHVRKKMKKYAGQLTRIANGEIVVPEADYTLEAEAIVPEHPATIEKKTSPKISDVLNRLSNEYGWENNDPEPSANDPLPELPDLPDHCTTEQIYAAKRYWKHLSHEDEVRFYFHYTRGDGKGLYNGVDENTSFNDYLFLSMAQTEFERIHDI